MSNKPVRILMTGAGAPGAPGIIRCLEQDPSLHLTVADADEDATGRYLATDFVRLPKASEENFIDALLQVCGERGIELVLPLVTRELFPLAAARERFIKQGIRILVSGKEAIAIANDKAACYGFLSGKGIAVPAFRVVTTVEEFIHAAFELGHPQREIVFKPAVSNGSRGIRIVSDSLDESDQLFNHKPGQLRMSYPQALTILAAKPFPQLLVSEYLPGDEYSVDCLADGGKTLLAVPRVRHRTINGISVRGTFVNDEAIINYCSHIIAAIGLHGNIGIQLKVSAENKPLLLEINPRVQGTIVSAMGAGVNLPLLAVHQELGLPLRKEDMQPVWGTRFARYWTEVFY